MFRDTIKVGLLSSFGSLKLTEWVLIILNKLRFILIFKYMLSLSIFIRGKDKILWVIYSWVEIISYDKGGWRNLLFNKTKQELRRKE